jgi:hypothetical protein
MARPAAGAVLLLLLELHCWRATARLPLPAKPQVLAFYMEGADSPGEIGRDCGQAALCGARPN